MTLIIGSAASGADARFAAGAAARGGPFTPDAVNRHIKRIGARARFAFPVHAHMLRNACGYALANAGHDTRRIQGLAHGVDLRPCPLCERKAMLAAIGKRAEGWIALTKGVVGEGRALYRAVVDADLEGIVAKRLGDAYHPQLARWQKVLNRGYSQRHGRAEWFRERRSAGLR
jgi:hypothetical protein